MITTSKSNSEGSGGDAEETVERGSSANLELIREDRNYEGEPGLSPGSVSDFPGKDMKAEDLEKAIRNLTLNSEAKATRLELTFKLERARNLSADEERSARKAAWLAESQKTILQIRALQETALFSVFPSLFPVWEALRGNLGLEEKATLSTMAGLWRNLLERERVLFLFQKIFPILYQNCEGLSESRKHILNCRVVCKEWKKSIDQSLQNMFHLKSKPEIGWNSLESTVDGEDMRMSFPYGEVRMAFYLEWLSRTYSPHENPFITRKTEFRSQPGHGLLLSRWGSQIWDGLIRLNYCSGLVSAYDELRSFLRLVPNLKMLEIDGHNRQPFFDLLQMDGQPFEDGPSLKTQMARYRLPEMPQLKHLRLMDILVPELMVTELLTRFGSGLETLVIWDPQKRGSPTMYVGGISLPSLKQLVLMAETCPRIESRFKENLPSLEELQLSYTTVEAEVIPKLFRALSGLGGSLRKLEMSLAKEDGAIAKLDEATLKMLSLELPHLEKFSLVVKKINLKTLDFILPMAALKELSVRYVKPVTRFQKSPVECIEEPNEEVIQWRGFATRLYQSNIWVLFPGLRKVNWTVEKRLNRNQLGKIIFDGVYTREGFKKELKERQQPAFMDGELGSGDESQC